MEATKKEAEIINWNILMLQGVTCKYLSQELDLISNVIFAFIRIPKSTQGRNVERRKREASGQDC